MSNQVLRLGFAIGGAVLGAATGIGANVGFLAGSLIGGAFFPDEAQDLGTVEGSRLGDLSVSASTYGSMIRIGFGTLRMSGNMIWTSGIQEQQHTQVATQGGAKGGLMGGGGTTQTQITYTYFASFAMAFAEGPADDAIRIWADTKLIYDKRSTTLVHKPGLRFRFYNGNETQLPDPAIEADKGVGRVPAHRGMIYIVFEDLDLTDFGNRIPNITVEIAFSAAGSNSTRHSDDLTVGEGGIFDGFSTSVWFVDHKRRRGYAMDQDGTSAATGFRVYNLDTLGEVWQQSNDGAGLGGSKFGGVSLPCMDADGFFYGNDEGAANDQRIIKIEPNNLQKVAEFTGSAGHVSKYQAIEQALIVHLIHPTSGKRKYHVSWSFFDVLYVLDADNMVHVKNESPSLAAPFRGLCEGKPSEGNGSAFLIAHATGNADIYIYKLVINAGAAYDALVGLSGGVDDLELVDTIPSSEWGGLVSGVNSMFGGMLDPTDGGVILMGSSDSTHTRICKWVEGAGIVWTTLIESNVPNQLLTLLRSSKIIDHRFGWVSGADIACMIDLTDGEVLIENLDIGAIDINWSSTAGLHWDGASQSVICVTGFGGMSVVNQAFIGRAAGESAVLADIVDGVCERVGLDLTNDVDTSELVASVRGFAITRQQAARSVIEPLASAFLFDGIESDDKVKFKVRGRDPERTISRDDLIPANQETFDVIEETRVQEPELPRRLYLRFMDFNMDYEQNAVSARRVSNPHPTMRSRDEQSVEMPIVLTAGEAKQIVEKWLFTVWNERNSFKFLAPFEHQDLDPSDVITVTTGSGATLRTRVTKSTIGTDLSVSFEGTAEDKLSVVSTAIGQGGLGFPQKLPPGPADTLLFLLDTTLLRDVDDLGGAQSRLYFTMSGYVTGWRSGSLYQSPDGISYTHTGLRVTAAATWGIVTNKLPATGQPFATDFDTELKVALQEGALASVTESEFLNDVNAALVGNSTNGWEVILFKDAVEEEDGSYTLSTIMRGRRGTDALVNDHDNGEFFIFLDRATMSSYRMATGDLDQQDFYKGVGDRQIPEDADTVPFTHTGKDLWPYAPAELNAVVDGGMNIDLSWTRRTRIGGELRDGSGTVPLHEETEEYEIDIMNMSTVVRTFTGIATPSRQYDNADIVTDFGSVPASLTFRVYQISAVVGRGFRAEKTVTF